MTTIIKLAWRNVWRNRRRTIITSLAIIASVAMLIFFNGLLTGFIDPTVDNNVELETGHIKVYPPGYHEKSDLVPINTHIQEYEEVISTAFFSIPPTEQYFSSESCIAFSTLFELILLPFNMYSR